MPILDLRGLPPKPGVDIPKALEAINLAIAEVYGCEPKHVWSTWLELTPGHYVEGDRAAENQPDDTHPPIARLTCFEGKSAEEIEAVLTVAGQAIAEAFGVPGNVFVTYDEATSGRVIDGKGIVRKR